MALASGNPVNTAMYWKLSASGAIRVGSSPTEVNISFAFCVGVNHAQRRSKGDIQKCSQTIRSLQASPGPKLKSKQAISRFLEQQEGGYQLTNRDSQTQTFVLATMVPYTGMYSHETRHDLFATVVS